MEMTDFLIKNKLEQIVENFKVRDRSDILRMFEMPIDEEITPVYCYKK